MAEENRIALLTDQALDKALIDASHQGEGQKLMELYREAAHRQKNADIKAFFLTQAFIFALELGDNAAEGLRGDLVKLGRV